VAEHNQSHTCWSAHSLPREGLQLPINICLCLKFPCFPSRIPFHSILVTEQCGRVLSTPALFSGGTGFKFRLGHWLSWLRFLWISSVPPGICQDNTLNLAMTTSFYIFSSSLYTDLSSFHSMLYSLNYWKHH
jgi:hypothetical protein